MKKIIALAGAFALAACGGNDVEEPVDTTTADDTVAMDDSAMPAGAMQYAGTYEGSAEDGTPWSITLDDDGTYSQTEGENVTGEGSWTWSEAAGLCLATEGEAARDCFDMGDVQSDGTVEFTDTTGETMTMNKTM